ncbi:DUF4249 domain-containing protein [Paucihalobacter sp.]|uniref:DUF4249 domain-containing protein n=1 Tax=Paucihalobacter sp. TaxID=2850405 RepID=UPI002FE3A73E
MKQLVTYLLVFITLLSCEDVIDVDLNTEAPRLVIEASINWQKGTTGNEQTIKLSLTAPFFDETVPPANDAEIVITDSSNNNFIFNEIGNSGIYINNNFIPIIGETYNLTIIYDGETYSGTETLQPVVPIDFVEQNDSGGFSGEETELKAFFHDPLDSEDYYFFEFINDIPTIPSLEGYNDEFTNGNQMFGFYTEEELSAGDEVTIRIHGTSERFYNYMFILLQQISEEGGGPFETQPATVRGNMVNQTNPDHFPFGYFRLSEMDEFIYVVE